MSETAAPEPLGQQLAEAHHATATVLDEVLDEAGAAFLDWVTLSSLATGESPIAQAQFVDRLADGLPSDVPLLLAQLDELHRLGLIHRTSSANGEGASPTLVLTQAGSALFRELRRHIDQASAALYEGIPEVDLATTRRVLTEVTERANRRVRADAGGRR